MTAGLDEEVRLHVYEWFVATGSPPTPAETADALAVPRAEAEAAYRRLEQDRLIVLAPGTTSIWMANPLSAVPTAFRVETERGSFFGNCIWDALGILAMFDCDGTVSTACGDCGEPLELSVRDRTPAAGEAIVHFAVPAARWWENIGFT